MSNFDSKSQVSMNYVKSLGPASSVILLPFIDNAIWVEYFLPERLSENISVLLSHQSVPREWSSPTFMHQIINEGSPGPS